MAYTVNFYQDGKSIDYTPAGAVSAGTIVVLNGQVGVVKVDIAAGVKGALCVEGVFAVPKKNEAFVAGLPVWFDANGDPQGGVAGSGAATQIGGDAQAAGDILLGTAVVDAPATAEKVYVAINTFNPRIPTFAGAARITKAASANAAVTESGVCYDVTADAAVITLPATAAGLEFTVCNMAADGAALVEVDFQAADKNIGGLGIAAGGDGKKLSNTKATAKKGDFVTFVADGTDGYRIKAIRGTWAQEA
jgi:predicted RecA/RadA family phage recombinase